MANDVHETELFSARLRKLEKENMWIKRGGIGVAVVFALILLLTRSRSFDTVSSREFVLTDSSGRTRAELAMLSGEPTLDLYAASGEPRVELVGGPEEASLNLHIPVTASHLSTASINLFEGSALMASFNAGPSTTTLDLRSPAGSGTAMLSVKPEAAVMDLIPAGPESPQISLQTDSARACTVESLTNSRSSPATASMCVDSPGLPAFKIADKKGQGAVLGVARLADRRSGKQRETSPASLVLRGEGGKLLWSTPQ
ncbi:MAG TPA: hypothetical protein VKV79_03760 [Terriglobia bacterium]|nr:hypothetical protein [Terriglobia bacterium]